MIDAIVNPEPNWHPIVVHFVVGLLITATAALALVALAPPGWKRRASLQAAGDWMLAIGITAALMAIAAGFQAYYTVAHDGPSHAAMTEHRNWALATMAVFLLIGLWRWLRRDQTPSIMFVCALIVAAGLLASTAWHGGRLVFHHGLGVANLLQAEGPGHDHDHGDAHGHGEGGEKPAQGGSDTDHDHEGGQDHGDDAGLAHGGHDAEQEEAAGSTAPSPAAEFSELDPAGVVTAFHEALERKDEATVRKLLFPDVVIFESGNAERSLSEYAGHHLPADMAFAATVKRTVSDQNMLEAGESAVVLSESISKGVFNGNPVHARLMETMFLKRTEAGWRIAHIHWSSAKIVEQPREADGHDHSDGHDHEH